MLVLERSCPFWWGQIHESRAARSLAIDPARAGRGGHKFGKTLKVSRLIQEHAHNLAISSTVAHSRPRSLVILAQLDALQFQYITCRIRLNCDNKISQTNSKNDLGCDVLWEKDYVVKGRVTLIRTSRWQIKAGVIIHCGVSAFEKKTIKKMRRGVTTACPGDNGPETATSCAIKGILFQFV